MRRRSRRPPFQRGAKRRRPNEQDPDSDFGLPLAGTILPPESWTRTAVKKMPPPGWLNWQELFGRTAPLVLDLGCGNGRFTIQSAWQRPELDFFAIDTLPLVLRYATRRANQRGLANVRFAAIDAEQLLRHYVSPQAASEIHLYHPQPYHDIAQAGKRMLTGTFLANVWRALIPGGLFVLQTDNRPYWNYVTQVLPLFFDWEMQSQPWPDAPQGRTRREIYSLKKGSPIYRAVCRPLSELSVESVQLLAAEVPPPDFRAS